MRVGPIGPSPYVILRFFGPAATAFRSAPAQKVPFAPHSTATRAPWSPSNARNAAASALPVGRSIALRRSGRSRMIVVTGPDDSLLTLGRSSMVGGLLGSAHSSSAPTGRGATFLTHGPGVRYQDLSL